MSLYMRHVSLAGHAHPEFRAGISPAQDSTASSALCPSFGDPTADWEIVQIVF